MIYQKIEYTTLFSDLFNNTEINNYHNLNQHSFIMYIQSVVCH